MPELDNNFTDTQLQDLATLLSKTLARGNVMWLATSILGRNAIREAANDIGDSDSLAQAVIKALHEANRLSEAITLLRREAHANSSLIWGIGRILQGSRIGDDEALQRFTNDYEPFLNRALFESTLSRVGQTVCAIALGTPHNRMFGSGFLIAPDLVMTNFHILDHFIRVKEDGTYEASAKGSEIYCFFDYLAEPGPRIPPGGARHTSVTVQAADNWLVCARRPLPFDGTSKCPNTVTDEYDYVIVRLARAIGNFPARPGGGRVRGWLALPATLEVFAPRRVIVFQHPGGVAQQFDIGESSGLDPTSTRIRYSVSAAKGSSGGAAVDSDGGLVALHVSEVEGNGVAGRRLNQGVRIDKIAEDIARQNINVTTQSNTPGYQHYWSLNDDPDSPQPILGRTTFREFVLDIHRSGTSRILAVVGPPGSGVQFSIRLLRRTLGTSERVAVFSSKDLQSLTPENFVRALLDELGIPTPAGLPVPKPRATENISRWLQLDLPEWLSKALQGWNRSPMWVVINTVVGAGERLLWAEDLKELVASLAGARDPGQPYFDLPQFRWLFLGQRLASLPLTGLPHFLEDLSTQIDYQAEYAECMNMAWSSTTETGQAPIDESFLRVLASEVIAREPDSVAVRKILATNVSSMLKSFRARN